MSIFFPYHLEDDRDRQYAEEHHTFSDEYWVVRPYDIQNIRGEFDTLEAARKFAHGRDAHGKDYPIVKVTYEWVK